jgi:plasmid maintenance system antidote protein VapI
MHTAVIPEEVLGIDAETWMSLQIRYNINKLKEKLSNSISNEKLSVSRKGRIKKVVVKA